MTPWKDWRTGRAEFLAANRPVSFLAVLTYFGITETLRYTYTQGGTVDWAHAALAYYSWLEAK